jgi:hypothetical protein
MDLRGPVYGFGDQCDDRERAVVAVSRAVAAIIRLDSVVCDHPLRGPWAQAQRDVGLVSALRSLGLEADIERIFAARIGAMSLLGGHVPLGDLDALGQRWDRVAARKGRAELRALVARLAPERRSEDLIGLATCVATALPDCARASWTLETNPLTGARELRTWPVATDAIDAADLALALPFALRRAGLTRTLLPGLVGRPRAFARADGDLLLALTDWADALAGQAREGEARLRLFEAHARSTERVLASVRRPAALRRLVALSLQRRSLWAADLARVTEVDLSSAWRTLRQAAELKLVVEVPSERRSRGDGTLYAAPPWLRLAGLISAGRGRPRESADVGGADLREVLAELEVALAAADRLLVPLRLSAGIVWPTTFTKRGGQWPGGGNVGPGR